MILYQRAFQANSRIITTTDTLMQEVLNLKQAYVELILQG